MFGSLINNPADLGVKPHETLSVRDLKTLRPPKTTSLGNLPAGAATYRLKEWPRDELNVR